MRFDGAAADRASGFRGGVNGCSWRTTFGSLRKSIWRACRDWTLISAVGRVPAIYTHSMNTRLRDASRSIYYRSTQWMMESRRSSFGWYVVSLRVFFHEGREPLVSGIPATWLAIVLKPLMSTKAS
jgi:hypothetical protein